jgi:hypothetical protein
VIVLIDDTDNGQAIFPIRRLFLHRVRPEREALIILLPVLRELEKRRTWAGWGGSGPSGVLDLGGAAARKGGRRESGDQAKPGRQAKIRSDLDDKGGLGAWEPGSLGSWKPGSLKA